MAEYNRQVAIQLAEQLQEVATRILAQMQRATEDGPLIDQTCERLGKAISLLQTTVRL